MENNLLEKRMLASDLDGTLILEEKISQKDREAIKELRKRGGIFAISTGRPLNGIGILDNDDKIEIDYYVLLNGALILDSNREKISHKCIENNVLRDILGDILTDDMKVGMDTGYTTYVYNEIEDFPFDNVRLIKSIDEIKEEVSLLSITLDDKSFEEIEKLKDYINNKYGEKIIAYRNTKYIDVVSKGCSKGEGIKTIANLAGLEADKIYTIGDSYNDIAMFELSDNSFTFHRVEDGLKDIAKNIVEDVAECINNYMLV